MDVHRGTPSLVEQRLLFVLLCLFLLVLFPTSRSLSFSPREKRNVTQNATAGNDNKSDDSDAEDKPLDAFLLGKALAETVLERTATEVVNFISDATNLPTKIEDEMEQLKREVEKRAKEDAGRGV